MSKNLLWYLIIGYCIVYIGNGMVSPFDITNFSIFFTKRAIYNFDVYLSFQTQGPENLKGLRKGLRISY